MARYHMQLPALFNTNLIPMGCALEKTGTQKYFSKSKAPRAKPKQRLKVGDILFVVPEEKGQVMKFEVIAVERPPKRKRKKRSS